MAWGAASAKAKFSELLDEAEKEGPQLVRRRKREYLVVTREQWESRGDLPAGVVKRFVSAWTALRIEPDGRVDEDIFLRERSTGRIPDFE